MLKTLRSINRQEKDRLRIPRSVQDLIPIRTIYPDGIFEVAPGKYSRSYRFDDINYAVASGSDKDSMFLKYSEILNSLDSGAISKITINNRRMDRREITRDILLPARDDRLDEYRKEYNMMLLSKALSTTSIVQDKYLTISVFRNSIEDARSYFNRVGAELQMHFSRLGSGLTELDAEERLKILFGFYRIGEESSFSFSMEDSAKKGHSFKDYISPDYIEVADDYFMLGEKYGRVMFLKDYAAFLKDDILTKLTDICRALMLSIDIIPIPTDEAVREVENRMLGVETNAANWQRRQNANNNFTAMLPYDMELQRNETKEFLEDLTTRDQKMMFTLVTIVHMADTKKQLDEDTEAIRTAARERMCQIAVLKWQQMDGLNTALPIGVRKIDVTRTLTTESLAVLMPFRVQEIAHRHGIYYGQNAISKNMIVADREQLIGGQNLGAKQKSIIDRCTAGIYRQYQSRGYEGIPPTLQDFHRELLSQDEPEAKEIALAIELFTEGSLNTFAKHTNVDTNNRLICYDILDLGKQLMPIGMLVVLDSILNRITKNRAKGRKTFIFIDEIYLLFQHEYSANFLFTLWKRVRKYGAYCTGITQNVEDLLQSHTARTMLANSEFLIMLNQAPTDRLELAKLINISSEQMDFIKDVNPGCGLIKVGSALVPFENRFPKNTELYRLMSTKVNEKIYH